MRRVFTATFCLALVALIVGGFLLVRDFNQVFPQLRPGSYAGTLVSKSGGETVPWSVTSSVGSPDILVSIGIAGVPAQRGVVVEPSSATRLPLILTGADRRFRITGRENEEGEYGGDYTDPITSDQGTWSLKRFEPGPLEKGARDDLVQWVTTWQVLRAVESKIEEVKQGLDSDAQRIEKLHRYAVEEDSLQKAADSRLSSTTATLDNLKQKNTVTRTELDALLRNIDIGKRVSPAGRLVELSRESIQREGKWIEQVLQLSVPEVSGNFEEGYERAVRVKTLQDQISDERGLIRNLVERPRYRERGSERESEEEFYNGLQ